VLAEPVVLLKVALADSGARWVLDRGRRFESIA